MSNKISRIIKKKAKYRQDFALQQHFDRLNDIDRRIQVIDKFLEFVEQTLIKANLTTRDEVDTTVREAIKSVYATKEQIQAAKDATQASLQTPPKDAA